MQKEFLPADWKEFTYVWSRNEFRIFHYEKGMTIKPQRMSNLIEKRLYTLKEGGNILADPAGEMRELICKG